MVRHALFHTAKLTCAAATQGNNKLRSRGRIGGTIGGTTKGRVTLMGGDLPGGTKGGLKFI